VLAVFAVKVNTDTNNPADVVTLDSIKINNLRNILNDMVTLSHSTEEREQEQVIVDENGNKTTETVMVTVLIIEFEHLSAEDITVQYRFSHSQKQQMRELLRPEYVELWESLLGDIPTLINYLG